MPIFYAQERSKFVRYAKMLAGFTKVSVPANGAVTAQLRIPVQQAFEYWRPDLQDFAVESGVFTLSTGPDARTTHAQLPLTVINKQRVALRRARDLHRERELELEVQL